MNVKKLLTVEIILLFIGIAAAPSITANNSNSARTIYVDDDGNADYTRIQDAIDNASDEDTVYVFNGKYYENVVVNESIKLTGEDRNSTIIDGKITGFTSINHIEYELYIQFYLSLIFAS